MSDKVSKIPDWLVPACFAFYLILNIVSWQFPFFWDSLLTSTICTWFFDNGWLNGIPPEQIDAGHPPLFYGYIFTWWKFLGRNLSTSHLAMLPFLWVMIYQFIQICDRLLKNTNQVIAAAILFCLETTIIAQSTMVSYDIVILAFYLFGLRYLLDNKNIPVAIAGIVLALISLRGAFAFGALFFTELLLFFNKDRRFKSILLKYFPAFLIFVVWNIYHYKISGWMLFTPSEQWADQRGLAGIKGSFKNVLVIIRNLLEPGRVLLYFIIFVGLILKWRFLKDKHLKTILVITIVPLLIFSALFVPFNNPIGHRYLMIIFALSILLFISLIEQFKFKTIWIVGTALMLISGHFWYSYYPANLSKGWDASLEHIAYFKARKKMWNYCDEHNIPISETSAKFPLDVSMNQSNLNNDERRPNKFSGNNKYVFVSPLNNNYETSELDTIQANYDLLKEVKNREIDIELWRVK
ncbi:MAG: hypothetical protein R2753_13490 [Chitinophagales bacterium]